MKLLLVAVASLVACSRAGERGDSPPPTPSPPQVAPTPAEPTPSVPTPSVPTPPATKDRAMTPEKLTWTMARTGAKLRVTYRYENQGDQVVYVNDGAVAQIKDHLWRKLTVHDVAQIKPDTALISVGVPFGTGTAPTPGFYVAVAPGATFDGARDVALPLTILDEAGNEQPIGRGVTKAVFALEVFDGEPARWREVKTDNGATIRFPDAPLIRQVQADEQPLP